MLVTTSIILDTRRIKKKTNKFPVKLRVYFQQITEHYQTVFDLTKEEFKKLSAPRITETLQQIKDKLKKLEQDAEIAVKELYPFSFEEFEKSFIRHEKLFLKKYEKHIAEVNSNDLLESDELSDTIKNKYSIFEEDHLDKSRIAYTFYCIIKNLLVEGRISSAKNYNTSYISLKNFKGNVKLEEITTSYLRRYEQAMLNKDMSKTTIGIYLRNLRAVFNEAIANKLIRKELYPFGRRLYIIPTGKNIKKALDLTEIHEIYYYDCSSTIESDEKARDFWLFVYFGNGMNIKDIALLKFKNVQNEFLIFERAKTARSNRDNPKPITIFMTDDMLRIIEKWGNKDKNPNQYIFPILRHGLTAQEQYDTIQLFIRFINEWMKRITESLNWEKKVTTYVARHSFSTVLKRSGASVELISESLGHSDIKTTENYLASFENSVKKEFATHLNAFKKLPTKAETNVCE